MNAAAETIVPPKSPPAAGGKKERDVERVTMEDGREVEFYGSVGADGKPSRNYNRFFKEILARANGQLTPIEELSLEQVEALSFSDLALRMDFRNGTTRLYPMNPRLGPRYAGHGQAQKYGDELAGEDAPDLDDWAATTDRLHERQMAGEWGKTRAGGGMGGTSTLVQALMEFTQRTREEVMAHIKDWSPQQKQSLRADPEIKPIVDRIEKEKAEKLVHVDTSALKASLKALAA